VAKFGLLAFVFGFRFGPLANSVSPGGLVMVWAGNIRRRTRL
jgi:hypothetical protein